MKTIVIRANLLNGQVLDYPEIFTNKFSAEINLKRAEEYFQLTGLPFDMEIIDEGDN